MIVALDVGYRERDGTTAGRCAYVGFDEWFSEMAAIEGSTLVNDIAAYVPGRFFERELPCLLAGLEAFRSVTARSMEAIVVDGHVRLDEAGTPGLGWRLFDALGALTPVVGVAKRPFRGLDAIEVLRGESAQPLYVTAVGVDDAIAAGFVASMAGPSRVPSMLRQVDRLSRA
ncbi:MAG: endonuclease V [Actinomycetota bacterium]